MKVLIVEDEKTIRKALGYMLRKDGYEITEAPNPVDALNIIQQQLFDFIIMDLNMPIISGLEFISMLREQNKDIPTIILTSEEISNEQFRQLNLQQLKILSKDLPLPEIVDAIKNFQNLTHLPNSFTKVRGGNL